MSELVPDASYALTLPLISLLKFMKINMFPYDCHKLTADFDLESGLICVKVKSQKCSERDSSPKKENSVMIYSPSHCSKPV